MAIEGGNDKGRAKRQILPSLAIDYFVDKGDNGADGKDLGEMCAKGF